MAATHLYAVLQGDYVAASLAGEVWQTGCRFATRPGSTAPVDVGAFVPFDVVALNQSVAEPTYTITSNWTTEMGITDLDPVSWIEDQLRPAAAALVGSNLFSLNIRLRSILVYPIRSPDGRVEPAPPYLQGSPARLDYTSGFPVGTGTASILPLQNSIVSSLRTQQVGRRGRGRMFLPGPVAGNLLNGRLNAGVPASYATAMKNFLEACRLDGNGAGGVYVAPCVTGAPFSDYALINQVRVGDVVDTQRRRRAGLTEAFSNAAVDPV